MKTLSCQQFQAWNQKLMPRFRRSLRRCLKTYHCLGHRRLCRQRYRPARRGSKTATTRLARSNHVSRLNAQIPHPVRCSRIQTCPIAPNARKQGTLAPATRAFRADRLHMLIVPETKETAGLMTVLLRADMVRITRRQLNTLLNTHDPTKDVQNDLTRVPNAETGLVVKNVTQDLGIHHRIDAPSLLSVKMGHRVGNRKDLDMPDLHLNRLETRSSTKGGSKNDLRGTIIWDHPGVLSRPIQKLPISTPKEQL